LEKKRKKERSLNMAWTQVWAWENMKTKKMKKEYGVLGFGLGK